MWLSYHGSIKNQIRLQLLAFACNLGNFFRQTALLKSVRHLKMTTQREKVIKICANVVRRARCIVFQLAEVIVSRELLAAILGSIRRLRLLVKQSGQKRPNPDCLVHWTMEICRTSGMFRQNLGENMPLMEFEEVLAMIKVYGSIDEWHPSGK